MSLKRHVAVFWDYENCRPPSNSSGYAVVDGILKLVQHLGSIILFKAYVEITFDVPNPKTILLHSELQSSGVSLTHCPHNGRKDVADKMMIADMLAFAIDNPTPATVVLITGDRDFAYAASLLRLRGYAVIVIVPPAVHVSLKMQATKVLDWQRDVLGLADLQRGKSSGTECSVIAPTVNPSVSMASENPKPLSDILVDQTLNASVTSCISGDAGCGESEETNLEVDTDIIIRGCSTSPDPSTTHKPPYNSCLHNFPGQPPVVASPSMLPSSPPVSSESLGTTARTGLSKSHAYELSVSSSLHLSTPETNQWEPVLGDSVPSDSRNLTSAETGFELRKVPGDAGLNGLQSLRSGQISGNLSIRQEDNWTWWDVHGNQDWNREAQIDSRCLSSSRTPAGDSKEYMPAPATTTQNEHSSQSPSTNSLDLPGSFVTIPKFHIDNTNEISRSLSPVNMNAGVSWPAVISNNSAEQSSVIIQPTDSTQLDQRFVLLIDILEAYAKEGIHQLRFSQLGVDLMKRDKGVYEKAGVGTLRFYVELAASANLVKLTKPNAYGERWVELLKDSQTNNLPSVQNQGRSSSSHTTSAQQADYSFAPLLAILRKVNGQRMLYSSCGEILRQRYPMIYQQAGVSGLKQYLEKARDRGLILLGGISPRQWVEAIDPEEVTTS